MPEPGPAAARVRSLWRGERPFVVALAAGAVLRVLVQVAFPPAFVFSDGPSYLTIADDLRPSPDRPVGYAAYLWLLAHLDRGVDLVAISQHLFGLATAVLLYALLRRRGVTPGVATLAVCPVLFDEMMLSLEHSVLSDVLFQLLMVAAVAVVAWRPAPRPWATVACGLLVGVATTVRLVGGPPIVVIAVFVALVATTWRARVAHVAALVAAFALPVVLYAAWYHHGRGAWTLVQTGGRTAYMRTTSFVDCAKIDVPDYERTLCPAEPVSKRRDPTYYGFHDTRTIPRLDQPPGTTEDAALRDFARRAIRQQPLGYAWVVGRDFVMPFLSVTRQDWYEYDTAHKWRMSGWVDYRPTSWTGPAYAAHGGEQPHTRHPLGDWLNVYGNVVLVPGPVLLLLVVMAAAGAVVRRRATDATRPLVLLLLATPLVLILVPDVTAQFTWRYQLPLLSLLPAAAALGWTRLRAPRADHDSPRHTGDTRT